MPSKIIETCPALPQPQSNRGYTPGEIIESFMVNIWRGANRFSHTEIGRHDYPLTEIFQWRKHLAQDTYKKFFKKFDYARNNQVFSYFYRWFFENLKPDECTPDIDSSVFTRYGKQEKAKKV